MPFQLVPARLGVQPFRFPQRTFLGRLVLYFKSYLLQYIVRGLVGIERRRSPKPSDTKPTVIQAWPSRPHLAHRVFYPPGYDPASRTPLPLYLDIHGGGWVLFDPQADDPFCSTLAKQTGFLVVSLNYSKSPSVQFPTAYEDIVATILDILADPTLHLDHDRVAVGGFSAGGQLALSASLAPELKGKIQACVPIYPAVDQTIALEQKLARRVKTDVPDVLEVPGQIFDFAHVPEGQDRTDPRLSPAFGKQEELPPKLFFIGAELDCLCQEALDMASSVAQGRSSGREKHASKSGALIGWTQGGVKWTLVQDQPHHFTHAAGKRGKELEDKRARVVDETFAEIGRWLAEEAF